MFSCSWRHHGLLVLIPQQQIGRDILAQEHRVIAGDDGKNHIFGQPLVQGQILVKDIFQAADQGIGLEGIFLLDPPDRRLLDSGQQEFAVLVQIGDFGAVLAFHQNPHQVIRNPQNLLDLGNHAISKQVVAGGLVGVHLLLGDQKYIGIVAHRPLDGGDALFTAHLKVNQIVWEDHQPPQGNGRKMEGLTLHLDRYFLRHCEPPKAVPL